jgi:arsenate reductase
MCTGNSCRSIISEALINAKLKGIQAYSAGTHPSGKVNLNAKKILKQYKIWDNKYYSKNIDKLLDINFDLVITVCDHAKENCPMFPKAIKKIHIGFIDPDGKDYEEFEKTYHEIKKILLPKVKEIFDV